MSRPEKLYIYNLRWRDGIEGHYYEWVVADRPLERRQDRFYEWEGDCLSSHHTLGEAHAYATGYVAAEEMQQV
jgi:hypothetical protein